MSNLTEDEITLLAIKGMVGELEPDDRREFELLLSEIRAKIKKAGNIGTLVIALLGAELQIEE